MPEDRDIGTAKGLEVTVRYAAAIEPFHDKHADPEETLASLKTRVLSAFGLTEGAPTEGGTFTYKLFHNKDELTDLSKSVGSFGGHPRAVTLKLSQEVKQGTDCASAS